MQLSILKAEKRYYRNHGEQNWFYAVAPADCTLESGKLTVLTGRSGSGKTTLLQMAAGLLAPSAGEVLADGKSLYQMKDGELSRFRNRHIAVIPQGHSALGALTVLENILFAAAMYGKRPETEKALALMERFGIEGLKDVLPRELSGGEMRRMAIIRALMQEADLLLADEPTSDLDDENSRLVLETLKGCAGSGKTVLLVTHEMNALEYADVRWKMNSGVLESAE